MSANRNWGLVRSGATFEALATTLVFFEDPNASLFGRRGKDGGQDARSGDGIRVYQAKHHENGSAAKAISDAMKEAEKITKYRSPENTRYSQWQGVTHWRLVTNAEFNPTSKQEWVAEVVPRFAAIGLVADYWERPNLDALLDKHPEVSRAFFENSTRALLSLPEVRARLVEDEPFLRRDLGAFVGRTDDIVAVREFVGSDKLFLVMHGPGGVGKSRLLFEAGDAIAAEGNWQVLWANTATMSQTDAWFGSIVPERPTLLLVDEPGDQQLLQILAEQLGRGRTSRWKVVVTVRSPKDPVVKFLNSARMQPRCLMREVTTLSQALAVEMCLELLLAGPLSNRSTDWLKSLSEELASRFSTQPVWLTLAVHLVETKGDLNSVPLTSERLASEYLHEIVHQQVELEPRHLELLLRWVALLAPFNRDEEPSVRLLCQDLELDRPAVLAALSSLVTRRALIERGANRRLIELKPDVMRDHVLLSWLTVAAGSGDRIAPSDAARKLLIPIVEAVQHGGINGIGNKILVALARTEMLLRLSGRDVDLLSSFIQPLITGLETTSAVGRVAIANVMHEVAYVRPRDVVELSRRLRTTGVSEEEVSGLFGTLVKTGHDDVVLALAWSVCQAAVGASSESARKEVLGELCALTEFEAEIALRRSRGLPNDGKRAGQMVDRVLQGGTEFWGEFDAVAEELADQFVNEAMAAAPSLGRAASLRALLHAVLSVEREQMSSEGRNINIRRFLLAPPDAAWQSRERIRMQIRAGIERSDVPTETKQLFWEALVRCHQAAVQGCRLAKGAMAATYREDVRGDLLWTEATFAKHVPPLNEMGSARGIWDWHRRFDADQELKVIAVRLEAVYASDGFASEFASLVSWDDIEDKKTKTSAKATELACASDPAYVAEFVRRGQTFLGEDISRLQGVAWELGVLAPGSPNAQAFSIAGLSSDDPAQRYFALIIARGWVVEVRKTRAQDAARVVRELASACATDLLRTQFLEAVFAPPHSVWSLTTDEHRYLRDQVGLFLRANRVAGFLSASGWSFDVAWNELRQILEQALATLDGERLREGLESLVESVFWGVGNESHGDIPLEFGSWLMDQLILIADFDQIGSDAEWHLQEIFKKVQQPGLPWLVSALRKRQAAERADRSSKTRMPLGGSHAHLSRYVKKVEKEDAGNEQTQGAVRELLTFVHDQSSIGQYAPTLLARLDPNGLIVPAATALAIVMTKDPNDVLRLSRIAGEYPIGGQAWRTIAMAALSSTLHPHKSVVCGALSGSMSRHWYGTHGAVPMVFVEAVESARREAAEEGDPVFAPFWAWRLALAEADLRRQEEEAREERGE